MRLRLTKTLLLVTTASFSILLYNVFTTTHSTNTANRSHGRAYHITAEDILAMGRTGEDGVIPQPGLLSSTTSNSLTSVSPANPRQDQDAPNTKNKRVASVQQQVSLSGQQLQQNGGSKTKKIPQQQGTTSSSKRANEVKRLRSLNYLTKRRSENKVQVEDVTLPGSWTVTGELVDRLAARQSHVQETCRKYGLDKANKTYQPNAWEFLIDKQHNLVWCNVFKAASSTWMYNFNLLAGYSEAELLHTKESPVSLARKRYKRPSVDELQQALNTLEPHLSFMIVRHPLERLVSAYRDKILPGKRFYSNLSKSIIRAYRDIAPPIEITKSWPRFGSKAMAPSFPQFVQFLIDEGARGNTLDEHWIPMSTFCTPCLVPFDVFAKIETLQEDGNYIIFSSGIQDIIKPKLINRSFNGPTEKVADQFLCQLTKKQIEGLINLYKLDLELFQYDVSKYQECARDPSTLLTPASSKVV